MAVVFYPAYKLGNDSLPHRLLSKDHRSTATLMDRTVVESKA